MSDDADTPDCPECNTSLVTFRVPETLREYAPDSSAVAGICPTCLRVRATESAADEPEFGRVLDTFPDDEAGVALALLLDYTDDEDVDLAEYMEFKAKVVSQLECTEPHGCWRLTGLEIDAALRELADEPVAPSV